MYAPKLYAAGEKSCDHCGEPFSVPVETWSGHIHVFCSKPECLAAEKTRSGGRYVAENEIPCSVPSCGKFIPGGSYGNRTKHFVCSMACWEKSRYARYGNKVPFTCAWCGDATTGQITHGKSGNKFCNIDHASRYRAEQFLKTAGTFRPIWDAYESYASSRYRGKSVYTHRQVVVSFLAYLHENGFQVLEDVKPQTISNYCRWVEERGTANVFERMSHTKIFFDWVISQGIRTAPNPVISSVHRKKKPKRLPRPYDEKTLNFIWSLLHARGNARLRAEAAIAEEAGLRRDEIVNIRLDDVDLEGHRIFVRLPNKTMTERYAFFGEKAKSMIASWLEERDPHCAHDHLFHNKQGNPCNGLQMHLEFVYVLCKELRGKRLNADGLDEWSIHRLRHTMASRLSKAGANYTTIMTAGGWTTFSAMTGYAAVDPESSRRGYEEAMRRFHESSRLPPATVPLTLQQYLERTGKTA